MVKKCEFCGKEFEIIGDTPNERRRKYCDEKCRIKANNNKTNGKRMRVPLKNFVCSVCGKSYLTNRSVSMTCSPECRHERDKQLARERHNTSVMLEKQFLEDVKRERQKTKKVTPAHEIEAKARKCGMNYGMYYALLQMEKERAERERMKKGCWHNGLQVR